MSEKLWETAMGMKGYAGSPAQKEDMQAIENKWVIRAIDGYGKTLHKTIVFRAGCEPSEKFSREILRLFVKKQFSVKISAATRKDLS